MGIDREKENWSEADQEGAAKSQLAGEHLPILGNEVVPTGVEEGGNTDCE